MQDAVKVLREFGIESELVVASAHRTPYKALQYAESAEERGLEVIIAAQLWLSASQYLSS